MLFRSQCLERFFYMTIEHLPFVGQTKDVDGKTGYVLTLSAREQHIRREKASSNICSNQALCAFTAGVYMAAMGEAGMKQCARLCTSKAHYFAAELVKAGCKLKYQGEFFHEFVTEVECPNCRKKILDALDAADILGGAQRSPVQRRGRFLYGLPRRGSPLLHKHRRQIRRAGAGGAQKGGWAGA